MLDQCPNCGSHKAYEEQLEDTFGRDYTRAYCPACRWECDDAPASFWVQTATWQGECERREFCEDGFVIVEETDRPGKEYSADDNWFYDLAAGPFLTWNSAQEWIENQMRGEQFSNEH